MWWIILIAIVVAIILIIVLMHFVRPSLICCVLTCIPILYFGIRAIRSGDYDMFMLVGLAGTLSTMFRFGPACFEDGRETNTYLILGTLVEETTGESPVGTFFLALLISGLLNGIPIYGVWSGSFPLVGTWIIVVGLLYRNGFQNACSSYWDHTYVDKKSNLTIQDFKVF